MFILPLRGSCLSFWFLSVHLLLTRSACTVRGLRDLAVTGQVGCARGNDGTQPNPSFLRGTWVPPGLSREMASSVLGSPKPFWIFTSVGRASRAPL